MVFHHTDARRWLPSIAAIVFALAPALAADTPAVNPVDAAGWSALTLRDVEAMHALLRNQTSVPFDEVNPAYPRWLEDGYLVARTRAAHVTDQTGHFLTLRAYVNGFQDPHFSVSGELTATRWPGFIAAEYGGEVVVVRSDPADLTVPAPGAVIELCDGLTPSALVQERLSPFLFSAGMPKRWSIPFLFQDIGNPFAKLPANCQVRAGDQVHEIELKWRRLPSSMPGFARDFHDAAGGPGAAWGVTEPAPGVFWIGVPTFLHTGDTAPRLQALIDAVRSRGDEMRNARAIVIDTRGNGGGTFQWAYQLADAIFTPGVMKPARDAVSAQNTAREVRASPENVALIRKSNVTAFRRGNDPRTTETRAVQRREDRSFLQSLDRAIKENPPVLRWGSKEVSPEGGFTAQRPTGAPSPFPAQVYFLTNGSCMSACLWFADGVLKVPGVRLIGSETAGDTPYTDIRGEMLPSGRAILTFPMKIVRGRGRASLEVYQPDIAYNGNWDDASVRAWVMSLIEIDSR